MNNTKQIQAHALTTDEIVKLLDSSQSGLSNEEAKRRLHENGKNLIPQKKPPTLIQIFFHQFLNPLIYILIIAAAILLFVQDYSDAFFIFLVLMLNSIIGTVQEFKAEKSAQALKSMTSTNCLVQRDGKTLEVDSQELVLGDIIYLESGRKVPADLRLLSTQNLEIDESLLTGESQSVIKNYELNLESSTVLGDQKNMAFTGSLVIKGRGKGIVAATGIETQLGKIAGLIFDGNSAKPPLLIRMEKFTVKIAIVLMIIMLIMGAVLAIKGYSWHEVLMFCVALSVAAIPEGLPVSLTVALAIASHKMSKRHVIVRNLPAVEALGSCSYIATDKTGTLTVNQLTITKIALPNFPEISIEGSGLDDTGEIAIINEIGQDKQNIMVEPLVLAGVLCNESKLNYVENEWVGLGDTVDLSFLVLANKTVKSAEQIRSEYKLINEVPFEPENLYAASLHSNNELKLISVKGAYERVLSMCTKMQGLDDEIGIDKELISKQAEDLATNGYRVLALARKTSDSEGVKLVDQLKEMTFLGLVGMIDPLRPEAAEAVAHCKESGIQVAMVTGDHPKTAYAIAKELGLADNLDQVVTGLELKSLKTSEEKSNVIGHAKVFARVEPQQKLEIVKELISQGHFVAVTGDGVNDAPALKAANVGVSMGKSGTDIAKESSDLIITDDRFASIIAGIEEGRISYNNIRKVVYLLISTGAAEILLFVLSIIFNTPLPLTAVQVLWLNLVTNGIQDKGLAFEPGEGDELKQSPRDPNDQIFNRLMIERIMLSAAVMGGVSFIYFKLLIDSGVSEYTARNLTLLLMVLFENVMVGNCRSETKSAFALNPLNNKILFFGTIISQLIHIAAIYTPGLNTILSLEPVELTEWAKLFFLALSVLLVMEIYKKFRVQIFKEAKY